MIRLPKIIYWFFVHTMSAPVWVYHSTMMSFDQDRPKNDKEALEKYIENYPYMLVASTISGKSKEDEDYWNLVVDLLCTNQIEQVMENGQVMERCLMTPYRYGGRVMERCLTPYRYYSHPWIRASFRS